MIEYKVRRVEGEGTGDIERICNEHAKDGWRLVSTNVARLEKFDTIVFLFFEREVGDQQAPQDTWRARHGGPDAG